MRLLEWPEGYLVMICILDYIRTRQQVLVLQAYLAALEAGADGIDLASAPVSGGTSQPDMLTMLHATKGMNYNLGDLEINKVLEYQEFLKECLKDYFIPPEATQVQSINPICTDARRSFNCKYADDER